MIDDRMKSLHRQGYSVTTINTTVYFAHVDGRAYTVLNVSDPALDCSYTRDFEQARTLAKTIANEIAQKLKPVQ